MDEETYVVRIYRRNCTALPRPGAGARRRRHDQVTLAGVVEDVEVGDRRVFHDIGELWAILAHSENTNPKVRS